MKILKTWEYSWKGIRRELIQEKNTQTKTINDVLYWENNSLFINYEMFYAPWYFLWIF